ncbi:nuclease-related domain-containing protein [Acetobacterium malicum]|uniref:nuclease-related domain-containing protein n=1 Tax=Acetobacterium malicum TaxID=52692 RepID=UPI00041CE631|nr:nuclease-related domain-containing protein [Acetobacterium dehalogenans]
MTFMILIILIGLAFILYPRKPKETTKKSEQKPELNKQWDETDYAKASGYSQKDTLNNKGNRGEYLSFQELKKLEGDHRVLVNLYLPKSNGETTEIDLLLLSETGIYVIESKNYSGWIYGDEKNKYWTQVLNSKSKKQFFNPIWQNKTHIKALKEVTKIQDDNFYVSYIVFGDTCTLKMVNTTSKDMKLLYLCEVVRELKSATANRMKVMTSVQVDELYLKLQAYSRANEETKNAHIQAINKKVN